MQQECYGLPYAMEVHDVETLDELYSIEDVNRRRTEDGWVLLATASLNYPATSPFRFLMGIPRPQVCSCGTIRKWYHRDKRWNCPDCL